MDAEKVELYLQSKLPAARGLRVERVERVGGGASRETWLVDAAWTEGGAERKREFVFRRDPPASLLETDRHVEFEVMRAARAMVVPVPEMYWLETDSRWLERPFAVMERMRGVNPPVVFPAVEPAAARARIASEFVEYLGRIHRGDWRAAGLDFLGVPASAREAARSQVDRWAEEYARSKTEERPILSVAIGWLRAHLPAEGEITLVHADYRAGNFLYEGERITAVLDWELAHLGDPLEDLAWAVLKFWSTAGLCQGLMPRQEMIAAYERATGRAADRERLFFYEVLGNVKMAVIAITGVKSFNEGRVADVILPLVGLMVPRLENDLLTQLSLSRNGH